MSDAKSILHIDGNDKDQLVPSTWRTQIPVVVLTRFNNEVLLKVAKLNGAFVTLQKDSTSGDELEKVVHNAIVTIPVNGRKTVAAAPSNSTLDLD